MRAEYKISLPLQTLETAEPAAKDVLEKAKAQVGFIPNMYQGMANLPGLLETYLTGYDAFRKGATLSPAEQELVFLTISAENGCDYCMAAHSMLAEKISQVPAAALDAVRAGVPQVDARLQALVDFTQTMVRERGLPRRAEAEAFLKAGYTERNILEILLAIAVKTISNYSNHLFHTPVDDMFAAYTWTAPAQHAA